MGERPDSPSAFLMRELLELLQNFESELNAGELRSKVQALVPVHQTLLSLGKSLIPAEIASSARNRILHYFLSYPFVMISREELAIVAGIEEWARRLRELRVEHGWSIINGVTAKQMKDEGEFPFDELDVTHMRPDEYILLSVVQDRDAAYRWNVAKSIRASDGGVRTKILQFLQTNVGKFVTGEELRYVANDKTEWARRVRELRTEYGWPIVTKSTGRPDLPVGSYLLEQNRQSPEHDRSIADNIRREVLRRDEYQCQRCQWSHEIWNPSDTRHLEIHHMIAHVEGGTNTDSNLITRCTVCHDLWHAVENRWQEQGFQKWLASR